MDETTSAGPIWAMLRERWGKSLVANNRSENTIRGYLFTVDRWISWLASEGHDLEPEDVRAHHIDDFIVDIITRTSAANAAHNYRNLRVFFAWLKRRKQIVSPNPFEETEPPTVAETVVPLFSDEDHAALLLACQGRSLQALRDTAIILLFIDTGIRVGEMRSLTAAGVDFKSKTIEIVGKGRKIRWIRFGNSAGLALARYMKVRAKHPSADLPALWLSRRNTTPLSADGIKRMLVRRGAQAGITGVHAHRFRHDFTHRWKAAGGSEEGLMVLAGWSSTKMPRHYGKQAQAHRAHAEHERISPADKLSG